MEGSGITPVMNVGNGYGYGDGLGFGGSGLWLFAILALMWGGNGGFFGNNNLGFRPSTAEDVNNGFNFAELQAETRDILSAVSNGTAQAVAHVGHPCHAHFATSLGQVIACQGCGRGTDGRE